jgi:site-specific DNA recombinase
MAQQLEALREHAAREGYEVLEEVADPGQSGASLERPGMDRVRDRVAAGDVSVVLAQDRDRITREPAYHYLLKREFEEHGTKIRSLNDRGDESPEGELTDGILDQLAKFERAKTTERTRRGRLRKAKEGKINRNSRAHYGFRFDESGEHYLPHEEELVVVRRIIREASEGKSTWHIKCGLEEDGIQPPTNPSQRPASKYYWNQTYVRNLINEDVYRPHTHAEMAELVTPDVAAALDRGRSYGIYWFNRTRTTRKRVSETNADGERVYRWSRTKRHNSRDQWVAIPVPDAGIPRQQIDTARELLTYSRRWIAKKKNARPWQIPTGVVRCGECGTVMQKYAPKVGDNHYAYYKCSRLVRFGKEACCLVRTRTCHRAERVEALVWDTVSTLLRDPERLRAGLEEMIEAERNGSHGDPEQDKKAWLERISTADAKRARYQDMTAEGLIGFDDLRGRLVELDETRATAKRELTAIRERQSRVERLEADREALLEHYAGLVPEALDALTAEERHDLYKLLRLEVKVYPDEAVEVSGVLGREPAFTSEETVRK